MKFIVLAVIAALAVLAMGLFVHFTSADSATATSATINHDSLPATVTNSPARKQAPASSAPDDQRDNSRDETEGEELRFEFAGVQFIHRVSTVTPILALHEHTPPDQDDLDSWTDMISIINYRHVNDLEALNLLAAEVLNAYQSAGSVIAADAFNEIDGKPSEYRVLAILFAEGVVEAIFARYLMQGDLGTAVMYARRAYGDDKREQMHDWLTENAQAIDDQLMAWDSMPDFTPIAAQASEAADAGVSSAR